MTLDIVAFSHIPKTAGMTFSRLMQSQFGMRFLSARPRKGTTYTKHDLALDLRLWPRPRILAGHGLYPFNDFGDAPMRWVTFLRDPQKTLASMYVHRRTSTHRNHREARVPLADWLKPTLYNWQTRRLAGKPDLEAAKNIIKSRMALVGLVERFDESLVLFRDRVLQDPRVEIGYRRVNSSRDAGLSKQVNEELAQHPNREAILGVDEALYAWVRDEVFPSYVESYGGEEKLRRDTDRWVRHATPSPLARSTAALRARSYLARNALINIPYWKVTQLLAR